MNMDVLGFINGALNWVNDPMHKSLIAIVGGWVWNLHQGTVTKAAPAVLMVASAAAGAAQLITAVIATAFPQLHPAGFTVAAFVEAAGQSSGGSMVWNAIFGTIAPVLLAVGAHSWPKNFMQWLSDGAQLLVRK